MVTIFVFGIATVILLGAGLLLWDSRRLGEPASLQQYECFLSREPNRFRHLSRILSRTDAEFLERATEGLPAGSALRHRFWKNRRRVLRYTLEDLQTEYSALVAVGLMIAGSSAAREESFAVKLVARSFLFNATCRLLRGLSHVPLEWMPGIDPGWLVGQVAGLRQTTRGLLAVMTPGDMDSLRDNILN